MKKVLFIILACLLVFTTSCELPTTGERYQNVTNEVILVDDDIMLKITEEYTLNLVVNGKPKYHFEYDNSFFLLEKNVIKPLKTGTTTLTLMVDDKVEKEIDVTIYQVDPDVAFTNLDDIIYVNNYGYFKVDSDGFKYSVSDEAKATINEKSGFLVAKETGWVTIKATSIYDSSIIVEKELHIVKEGNKFIVSKGFGEMDTRLVFIGDEAYEIGKMAFDTLSSALSSAKAKYPIVVLDMNNETVEVTKNNLVIDGSAMQEDVVLNIKINQGVSGVKIDCFHLTGDSHIELVGGNSNITICNNVIHNTSPIDLAWQATNAYTSGIIVLKQSNDYHNHIFIQNNEFDTIADACINASTVLNFTVQNNSFKNFDKDAVRMNQGIVKKTAKWLYEGNDFINGTYSGLYFRTYGSDNAEVHHYVAIFENYFEKCGKDSEQYSAGICFRNYQEGSTEVNIAYNNFRDCNKMIFLRNNAKAENQDRFTGTVMGNVFETVPSKYYFNNLNSSDTVSTNPVQTNLLDNNFRNNGIDITPTNTSLFIGARTNQTITSAAYLNLLHVKLPHVLYVDEAVDVDSLGLTLPVDGEYLDYTAGFLTPLKEGNTTVSFNKEGKTANYSFRIIKQTELVVKFIMIALGEIGYQEMDANGNTGTSGNYTKYGAWYGINPGAWCAMYVSWCANQAGVSTNIIPKYASVSLGMEWFQNKGLFQYKENYTPKAGDILFMKSDGASHTGIVLYCDGVTVYTVEGNTSDQCAMRKYSVNYSKITGYGTPEWPSYSEDGYNFSNGTATGGEGNTTT